MSLTVIGNEAGAEHRTSMMLEAGVTMFRHWGQAHALTDIGKEAGAEHRTSMMLEAAVLRQTPAAASTQ